MLYAYSIAHLDMLYIITVFKERIMIRILCPFCHTSLGANELEAAHYAGHECWLCPECSSVLVSEAVSGAERSLESAVSEWSLPAHV